MATSIADQLQKIKAITQIEPESTTKRPFTRPSILFDPKEAADIDLDALLSLALSGLEALEQIDSRFGSYKNSLFSPSSRDLDRELRGTEENKKIDESIASYLRLISGYLQLHSALKTLEYLIRRFKIYHYNMDELILCSLPFHDTHAFVRIVQLLNLGNSSWRFLEGVKVSGAPPPRSVIVQQCIRDIGVLETLCNYALPTKKYKPSVPVLNFFTAVAVEFLGTLPVIDSDTVRRLLPFVFSGLETNSKVGRDHKASALMMVSLLSNKVTLNHKSVKVLIESIARVARQDATESADLPWLRMLLMAMISLVQSQSVQILSKKSLEVLQETRDFTGVLLGLSKEFNIKKFLYIYLESLATYSSIEHYFHLALVSAIETLPVKEFMVNIVAKVLTYCLTLSKSEDRPKLDESGSWAKEILDAVGVKYPSELQRAAHRFLEDPKVKSIKENSVFEKLGSILGGRPNGALDISDSMILLSLEHPKAEIRRATVSSLVASGGCRLKTYDSQTLANVRDAVLRRLHDEDMGVVNAALSLNDLNDIVDTYHLIGALNDVLLRCIDTIMSSESFDTPQACDVAVSCLNCAILNFQSQFDYSKGIATMIFPLLLVFPKTWRLNVKALELAKGIQWPLYHDICGSYELISTINEKKLESSMSKSVNMKTIRALAEAFSANPEEHMTWFSECSTKFALSKTIILLVILQSFVIRKEEPERVLVLFQSCFQTLKQEWEGIESSEGVVLKEEVNSTKLDDDYSRFFEQPLNNNCNALHSDLLICIFWKMLKAFIPSAPSNVSADEEDCLGALDGLFTFFVESRAKNLLKEHIQLLVLKCHPSPVQFLTKFHTMGGYSVLVQVESLQSFATICSQTLSSEKCASNINLQLLLGFPSVLVPLSSDDQDVRIAAMKCIEVLYNLWHHINSSGGKNGNDGLMQQILWSPFLGELLELLIEQKRLILSDGNFFSSYLTAILGSSSGNILVPLNIDQRFDRRAKEAIFLYIMSSALKLSPFGKLKVLLLFRGMRYAVVRVEGVKFLLSELLQKRTKYHLGVDKYCQPLSKIEIETLCFLLECCAAPSASEIDNAISDFVVEALQVNSFSAEDPAVVQPCVTALQMLNLHFQCRLKSETQEKVFEELMFLFRNDNASIQNAAKDAIVRVKVPILTIVRLLELFTAQELGSAGSSSGKKKKKFLKEQGGNLHDNLFHRWENRISFLGSLLDILLLKKDIENRSALAGPLFKLLSKLFSDEWILGLVDKDVKWSEASSWASTICFIQQTVLTILEEISVSLSCDTPQEDNVLHKYDVKLLLEFARLTTDPTTRNHVFSLLSSIAKNVPDKVFEYIIDIFTVIGESAAKQGDSNSQRVFEDLVSTIVPCWLSKVNSADNLLQIFVDVLPEVAEHRRLTIMVFFLRTLGVRNNLASLLILLIRSAVTSGKKSGSDETFHASISSNSVVHDVWEYKFVLQVCSQYSCMIWLPSLVLLLKQAQNFNHLQEQVDVLLLAVQFVLQKLQDTELGFKLESGEDSNDIQRTLGALLEQVVSCLQLVNSRGNQQTVPTDVKKELKESVHSLLKAISRKMLPSAFFDGIGLLLKHPDGFVRRKALKLLCEAVNDHDMLKQKHKKKRNPSQNLTSSLLFLDGNSTLSFVEMCSKIIQLIDASDEGLDISLKVAAISTLENLANSFSANSSVFISCLISVSKQIGSQNLSVSCNCLRATGALIKVLDTKALLPELPRIMGTILSKVRDDLRLLKKSKHSPQRTITGVLGLKESLPFSVLVTLEAVIEKLGRFLSPYLGDIIELMVLSPEVFSGSDLKIKVKADTVRRLITENIDVRYILTPLLEIYHKAVELSESSVLVVFEMLSFLIGKMDRLSVSSYHGKIFEKCLLALDLRRAHPESIKNVHVVEKAVIRAMLGLTMKVTETMFKPLFIRSLEWSETLVDGLESTESTSLDRFVSFYGFVNELVEHQRSLFVPYFKYLLEGCTWNLIDGQVTRSTGVPHKIKKAKTEKKAVNVLCPRQWHLRALILSSLQKCFLYDSGSKKFLDSTNFQVLLKPIVLQLIAEPPNSVDEFLHVPSVDEVDDILVTCLGQMAVTAGSDLLWKPLNHEVLMQTRSENIRTRILGLRVVKYFVEHLKEEYLVLMAETIPFLGELLEDVELPVKSLAQEILKEMETLSGESLRDYL